MNQLVCAKLYTRKEIHGNESVGEVSVKVQRGRQRTRVFSLPLPATQLFSPVVTQVQTLPYFILESAQSACTAIILYSRSYKKF